jgi:hypothetical protein
MKILFKWYDFRIGFSWDAKNRRLYFFPMPMIGMVFQFGNKKGHLPDVFANETGPPEVE